MRRTAVALAVLAFVAAGCGAQGGGGSSGKPDGGGGPAAGKPELSWTYETVLGGSATLGDMAVVGEDDIWAYGGRRIPGPEPQQFLLHYDGTRWREQTMPEVLGADVQEARLESVGSGEVWLTANGESAQSPRIARWDGTRWSLLTRPPADRISDIKAFGPEDVWLLAGEDRVQHWDGSRWTVSHLPAAAVSLDGTSSDDLWAVGHRRTGVDIDTEAGELTQPAAVHWDGHTWKLERTPAYHFPEPVPPEPDATLGQVLALAEDDVRAYGSHTFNHGEVEDEPADEAIRLRWDGARWNKQRPADGQCGTRIPVARDGSQGLFLDGNWYVTTDGACLKIKRSRLPDGDGVRRTSRQSLWLAEVTRVPGTANVVGVGHVQVNQSGNPMNKAVIVTLQR